MSAKNNSGPKSASPSPTPGHFAKAKIIARTVGVSSRTVFRWADANLIHRYKINDRVVLFDENEVRAFVESTRV